MMPSLSLTRQQVQLEELVLFGSEYTVNSESGYHNHSPFVVQLIRG